MTGQTLALLALVAGAAASGGGSSPPDASPGVRYESVAVPVPAVALDAKTDGKAELRLSVGVLLPVASEWDLSPRVALKSTTNEGLDTLFSWTSGKGNTTPLPWSVGGVLVLTHLPARERDVAIDDVKLKAYAACQPRCLHDPVEDTSKVFCEKRGRLLQSDQARWREIVVRDMKADDFCKSAIERANVVEAEEGAGRISAAEAVLRRAELLGECTESCDKLPSRDEAAYCGQPRFVARPKEAQARRFMEGEFCPDGNILFWSYREQRTVRDRTRSHPPLVVKVGGQGGRSQFKNLSRDPSGSPGRLVVDDAGKRTPWSAGGSFAKVLGGGHSATIEGIITYGHAFEASNTSARWCVPAGTVAGADVAVPAETCRELPVGAPTETRAARVALFGGYLDQVADSWRIAAGIDAMLPRGGGSEIAFAAPIWISFAGTAGKYLGVARLTPSLTSATDADGKRTWRFVLALSLLGQQTLFSPEFDQL
jgi:hypothetical protein